MEYPAERCDGIQGHDQRSTNVPYCEKKTKNANRNITYNLLKCDEEIALYLSRARKKNEANRTSGKGNKKSFWGWYKTEKGG